MANRQGALQGWSRLVLDIFILIMGIVMCTGAVLSGNVAEIILGVLFIFYGTVMIGTSERERGAGMPGQSRIGMVFNIVWIVLGMLCLVTAGENDGTGWAFKLLLGVWMVISALRAWAVYRQDVLGKGSKMDLYLAIAELVLGILVICSMAAPDMMAGICMIIYGAIAIFELVRARFQR